MDYRNWGATPAERASAFPCDALAFRASDAYVRAVSIAAPAPLVFRWVCALRYAPYSYDVLDNFGRRSPPHLDPYAPPLAIGQRAMHVFRVVAFEADRSLTLALDSSLARAVMGDLVGSYRVDPVPWGVRLLAKVRFAFPRTPYGAALERAMPALDLVMFRKQLLTLRAYAERDALASVASASVVKA